MKRNGIILALITSVISGVSIFSNSIFVSNGDPIVFAFLRNCIVAVLLTIFLFSRGQFSVVRSLNKKEWGMLMGIGIIGGGIPFVLFFSGLSMIGAVHGNIIQKSLFLWVALLALPVLKEKLTKFQLIGYLALFVGLFVVGGTFRVSLTAGSYLVLAATFMWAVEHVIAKIALRRIDVSLVTWSRMIFGLPCLYIALMITGKVPLIVPSLGLSFTSLVASSVLLMVYMGVWYSALKKAPATLVSSILIFAPVVTMILGSTVLQKAVSSQQILTSICITVGLLLITISAIRPKQEITRV
jgi:drug/metabolite transporter (DMT)-like permease